MNKTQILSQILTAPQPRARPVSAMMDAEALEAKRVSVLMGILKVFVVASFSIALAYFAYLAS